MSLLIESIRVFNRKVSHIRWHNERCNASRKSLFGCSDLIDLRKIIKIPDDLPDGLFKCRIIYSSKIEDIRFEPYTVRNIRKLKAVNTDNIEYPFKFLERPELDALYSMRNEADEILIIKNGLLTDAYYYNVLIQIDGQYYTPARPLLKGTRLQSLRQSLSITPADITVDMLMRSNAITLINAMTPPGAIMVKPEDVIL
ncbi:MAG: hypothetical protein IPM26_03495 [Saprospiraceae bacterium]|nr:hypothetical protein [Saprospiraceae bacterium]